MKNMSRKLPSVIAISAGVVTVINVRDMNHQSVNAISV